jgi:hypothetical protein
VGACPALDAALVQLVTDEAGGGAELVALGTRVDASMRDGLASMPRLAVRRGQARDADVTRRLAVRGGLVRTISVAEASDAATRFEMTARPERSADVVVRASSGRRTVFVLAAVVVGAAVGGNEATSIALVEPKVTVACRSGDEATQRESDERVPALRSHGVPASDSASIRAYPRGQRRRYSRAV